MFKLCLVAAVLAVASAAFAGYSYEAPVVSTYAAAPVVSTYAAAPAFVRAAPYVASSYVATPYVAAAPAYVRAAPYVAASPYVAAAPAVVRTAAPVYGAYADYAYGAYNALPLKKH